jgi:hypothetical protein
MRIFLLFTALILAGPAAGGAWMRAEGTGFLAFSNVYSEVGTLDGGLYAEYGVRPNLTLGIKVDANMIQGRVGAGTAFVFMRRPVPMIDRPFQLAYELGIGSTFGTDTEALMLTGLSYGRGTRIGQYRGWLAVDGSVEWALGGNGSSTGKLDTTLGLTLSDRFKVMMQVFHSQTDSASSTTLAPSLIWQPRPDASSYQFGLENEGGAVAVKFGVWRSF